MPKDLNKAIPSEAVDYLRKSSKLPKPKLKIVTKKIGSTGAIKQVVSLDKESIPRLTHGLEEVLKKNGVQYLYLTRERKYQFHKSFSNIDQLDDFKSLKSEITGKFVSPSKDEALLNLSRENDAKYYSSTSSMTSTLFQFYMLLNSFDTKNPSASRFKFGSFTNLMSSIPASTIVSKKDAENDIYSVEIDKSCDIDHFLSEFGHIAEIVLTNDSNDIKRFKDFYNRENDGIGSDTDQDPEHIQDLIKFEKFKNPENIYNISKYDKFLMRSQLDCYSPLLKENGTFDLKSRAISEIRYDMTNRSMRDTNYSNRFFYLDEMDDLIRTAGLLKYSFQARIGQMSGIFVAFHNIRQFLAFEYLSLEAIDKVFFDNSNIASYIANSQFKFSLRIWGQLLDMIKEDLNADHFRVVLKSETVEGQQFNAIKANVVALSQDQISQSHLIKEDFNRALKEASEKFKDNTEELASARKELLKSYKTALDDFNKSTISDRNIVSYTVETIQLLNDKRMDLHKLPTSTDDKWSLVYKIIRERPDPVLYLKHLSAMTKAVTKEFAYKSHVSSKSTSSNKPRSKSTNKTRSSQSDQGYSRPLKSKGYFPSDNRTGVKSPIQGNPNSPLNQTKTLLSNHK
ncbi:Pet127-domain-containing protein [Yamadazyma tenuis ATCC 10573]|uniref:Pet127-domain-containing protein n=2 Tax=Candida tenuis TaxID=2315449 RepID=G3AWL3_CANTC|nr:Pet127-domain-containing protein [Yamadazyma tenuis ATCC 10573]EGV66562.1 Pet127-domain-containing protein [Yamadazyma tenuis ATCC 10573]